jgi:hypothetical protein
MVVTSNCCVKNPDGTGQGLVLRGCQDDVATEHELGSRRRRSRLNDGCAAVVDERKGLHGIEAVAAVSGARHLGIAERPERCGALQGIFMQQYDVSSDGQRFLMNTITEEAASPITVVLNRNPEARK